MVSRVRRALEIGWNQGLGTLADRTTTYCRNEFAKSKYIFETPVTWVRGRNLFDYDWDLAIVLDACRYDLAATRGPDHQLDLGRPERVYSLGSTSKDWIRRTFSGHDDAVADTAYVSANPFSDELDEDDLETLDKVYEYAWDPELGTVPPRPVTDRTIDVVRNGSADRCITHYMQPHLPSIESQRATSGDRLESGELPDFIEEFSHSWKPAKTGENPEAVVENYRQNLFPVLDEVQLLLQNVDAERVVITADHGNYLGEKGRWAHPYGHVHSAVRHVPWWETDATDRGTHTPREYDRTSMVDREEQLESLGYL